MNYKFPWFSFETKIYDYFYKHIFKRRFKLYGKNTFLSPYSEILNTQNIEIGENVTILSGAWIMAIMNYGKDTFKPLISIGNNTYIGHHVTLSSVNRISIGDDVTFGDNVYIADNAHSYDDINTNIMQQRLKIGTIKIGNRAWIGKNSTITFNVEIGEHSIVGANSYVNAPVPPYTVVAGNPARVIKKFDFEKQHWVSVQ